LLKPSPWGIFKMKNDFVFSLILQSVAFCFRYRSWHYFALDLFFSRQLDGSDIGINPGYIKREHLPDEQLTTYRTEIDGLSSCIPPTNCIPWWSNFFSFHTVAVGASSKDLTLDMTSRRLKCGQGSSGPQNCNSNCYPVTQHNHAESRWRSLDRLG